jgi:hypothetical protein
MPVEEVVDVRDALVAALCDLVNEVGRFGETAATFDEAEAGLRGWGRIPNETLQEIHDLYVNLDVLARIGSISPMQAKVASAPARQVIQAFERLTQRLRHSQAA